jgi:formate hydrogenlyase subunit 4
MRFTPYVNMAVMVLACLFVPVVFLPQPVDYIGNIILLLYLFALAKFFMALSGLDSASTFGGMGSSREMTISSIIEPTVIVFFATLAFVLKTLNLHEMFLQVGGAGILALNPALIPLVAVLFIIMITEAARIPVDNPETHLELTMVHETMILEQSGRNLAMMELSHAMKQTLFMAIFINLFVPFGLAGEFAVGAILLSCLLFLIKGSILAVVIGLFESSFAKLRLFRLPDLFAVALSLSLITLLLVIFA